jgi:hypothetical protein
MPTLITLVSFNVSDGANPDAGLISDTAGDLFGTTSGGFGTVFELAKTAGSYASTPTTLVRFNGTNGSNPGGLISDAAGDLFSTTTSGGKNNGGTVFEIANTSTGYASAPATLASFSTGTFPQGGLLADTAGNLFGTTENGGTHGDGAVFEIANTSTGYASTPATLTSFYGYNGANPWGVLMADAAGDLFGTTAGGGANSLGTVFELAKTSTGYASTPTTLTSFNGYNGSTPYAGLLADAAGNLVGTTYAGGANGDGTVFEIANTSTGYASTPTTIINFNYTNGANPTGSLIIDAAGDLFGTTTDGGTGTQGTVFEIANTSTGYVGTPTTLVNFDGTNGATPVPGLIADGTGDLFGTTRFGPDAGTVFEVTGTGFVVPCYVTGTRIATPQGEIPVDKLVVGDLVQARHAGRTAITWIGHRHIDCCRHPKPRDVWPVRLYPGAFGTGMPHRDLWLSPDHAVFIDGVLIPIKYLINGRTVVQEPRESVHYFHIELAQHDILSAEGLPCESFLDTGGRSSFENSGSLTVLHPEFGAWRWEAEGCAPLIITGPDLQAVRQRLASLALAALHEDRDGRRAASWRYKRKQKVTHILFGLGP